jgi:predicted alpha/beta superfamily hydrolase
MREISETLRSTFRRALRLPNRRAGVRPGRLERIPEFESKILANKRDIVVYLPAGYDERQDQRYPVLYMHDGQNLFEPGRSFIPGQHWQLAEAANEAIGTRTASPMMIVGIDNAGAARIDEYTPTADPKKGGGGRADDHARMIEEELKPLIDQRFRTMPEGEHTSIGGSSLGGLAALYLALRRPHIFKSAAVMSPSVWWDNRVIVKEVENFGDSERPRVWLDIGGREGAEALTDARLLRDRMLAKGWNRDNFFYYEDRRGDHSERAWAGRVRQMLEFLFPPEPL